MFIIYLALYFAGAILGIVGGISGLVCCIKGLGYLQDIWKKGIKNIGFSAFVPVLKYLGMACFCLVIGILGAGLLFLNICIMFEQ